MRKYQHNDKAFIGLRNNTNHGKAQSRNFSNTNFPIANTQNRFRNIKRYRYSNYTKTNEWDWMIESQSRDLQEKIKEVKCMKEFAEEYKERMKLEHDVEEYNNNIEKILKVNKDANEEELEVVKEKARF